MNAFLVRTESGEQGTFGRLVFGRYNFVTAELPWKNNARNISCIPYGDYGCEMIHSPTFGDVYTVKNVADRTHILIHPGNYAGDEEKGYRTDSNGCILLGSKFGELSGQKVVLSSKDALRDFYIVTNKKPFKLTISGFDIW
jgi:hypothetical protein